MAFKSIYFISSFLRELVLQDNHSVLLADPDGRKADPGTAGRAGRVPLSTRSKVASRARGCTTYIH